MELSKIHEISYIINGETYVFLCSVTIKIMKFLREKVKTKKNYDCWEKFDGSQNICPKIGGGNPLFTLAVDTGLGKRQADSKFGQKCSRLNAL